MTSVEIWSQASGASGVLVHGGAGESPEQAAAQRRAEGCLAAAREADALLRSGGSALDAVERAVRILEDDPEFNAGTGACLNLDGALELDASIMEGTALRAGAVCVLPPFKNPIAIARSVLDDGRHVLYAAEGAARFAEARGFVRADPNLMISERSRRRLEAALARGAGQASFGGTVGAVARDRAGHLASATSTGGTVAKRPGRVGDTPLIGAGTYADNAGGAASATGDGEAIVRVALASRLVWALSSGHGAAQSAGALMNDLWTRTGGSAGVIVIDREGLLAWARSAPAMAWAAVSDGTALGYGI